MIFAAGLSIAARKALPNKCVQKSIGYIIQILPADPAVSDMEVLLLGPQDFKGAAAKGLNDALSKKHPNICAIFICANDKEKALCTSAGVNIKQVRKLTPQVIQEAVSEFYGQQVKDNDIAYGDGADRILKGDKNPAQPKAAIRGPGRPKSMQQGGPKSHKVKTGTDDDDDDETETEQEGVLEGAEGEPVQEPGAASAPETEPITDPEPQTALPPTGIQLVESVKTFDDWDVFTRQLERDSVISEALLRSSEFQGVRQMMEVYSVKMNDVTRDSRMTPEQKMAAIKDFGHNRQILAAASNSKMVDDWLKLWHSVVSVAESIVRERLDNINHAVVSTTVQREDFIEQQVTGVIDAEKAIGEYAVELINIESRLTDLWAFAYNESVNNIGKRLNEKLPSDNEWINSMLGQSVEEFRTDNAESLVNRIFQGLKESRISLSQVQDEISALYITCFTMLKEYGKISSYQKNVMDLLRANHVENIVVRDTLLKECFRVFVGTPGTGLTATTTIYASMMARRGNTVVIDMTGHPKYERYGHSSVTLGDFMGERIQQPLLFVTSSGKQDPEEIAMLLNELKARMSYYRNIIIVLDASQKEELDQLGREALTIAFVTNNTADSLSAISVAYQESRGLPNVGRLLCAIDAPVDASILINTLGLDISTTRLVLLPYMRDIRAMAITHQNPADYGDVLKVYEDAFRV